MEHPLHPHVIGFSISSAAYPVKKSQNRYSAEPATKNCSSSSTGSPIFKTGKADSIIYRMNKLGKVADNFASGVRERVKFGRKLSETVKRKLSLGAKVLQVGGVDKVFKQMFHVKEREKLLDASQCYLSTTAGPIAGLLFTSTEKVAFCSEKAIKFSSPDGKLFRAHYKVVIPLRKIKRASQSENVKRPSEKYIEVVTRDYFDFWFMGFLNYDRAFKHLQQGLSQF